MNNSFKYPDSVSHRQTSLQNKIDNTRKDEKPLRGCVQITKSQSHALTNNQNDNSHYENEKKQFYDVHISSARGKNKNKEKNSKISNDKNIIFAEESKFFIEMNRLLYSKNCIGIYIILSVICVLVLIYSIVSYFKNLNDLPLIILEIVLTIIVSLDMSIRIYVIVIYLLIEGCSVYFTKFINFLDIVLLCLSCLSIILFLKFRNQIEKIEDVAFALLICIRNGSQLLRLFILLKNQNEVRKNLEQFIHFSSFFEDKKQDNIQKNPNNNYVKNLNLQAISFVEEEMNKKNEIKNSVENLEYKETENNAKDVSNIEKKIDLD